MRKANNPHNNIRSFQLSDISHQQLSAYTQKFKAEFSPHANVLIRYAPGSELCPHSLSRLSRESRNPDNILKQNVIKAETKSKFNKLVLDFALLVN
jgi:hypothetical protein